MKGSRNGANMEVQDNWEETGGNEKQRIQNRKWCLHSGKPTKPKHSHGMYFSEGVAASDMPRETSSEGYYLVGKMITFYVVNSLN